jgi:hypothetical protein
MDIDKKVWSKLRFGINFKGDLIWKDCMGNTSFKRQMVHQ